MTLRIEIETDNEAFSDGNCGAEVARILRAIAHRIGHGGHATVANLDGDGLRDVNGNRVGNISVEK